jgi:uncharacterized membrane protein YphA (DoxX/SURF4 family)
MIAILIFVGQSRRVPARNDGSHESLASLFLAVNPAVTPKSVTPRVPAARRMSPAMVLKRRSPVSTVDMQVSLQQDETPEAVKLATDLLLTALRLGTCALMIHHGIDKIQHVDGFSANVVAKFFGFLPGPPQFWTLSAAATQVVGAVLLALGAFSRPVALSMCTTMVVAVIFHLLNTGPEDFPLGVPQAHSYNFELAAMYVFVLSYFTANGAGKFSVDEQILGGELQFYQNILKKLRGDQDEN